MKIVIIDNYDSFTYNLSHLVKELGADVDVVRNDQFSLDDIEAYDRIILSPGPGIPSEAGLLCDVIRRYAGRKPILGVCLGHQAIGEVFGARLENLSEEFHGVATPCHILSGQETDGSGTSAAAGNVQSLFAVLPATITVGRYHSCVVSADGLPDCIVATALSDEGQVMALRHRDYPVYGIQFHPESVLTPDGRHILQNFLNL